MTNITFVGAGSLVFTRNLCSDVLLAPALQDSTITLMDIDPVRLKQAQAIVQHMVDMRGLKAQVKATTDRRDAVKDADYVVTTRLRTAYDLLRSPAPFTRERWVACRLLVAHAGVDESALAERAARSSRTDIGRVTRRLKHMYG